MKVLQKPAPYTHALTADPNELWRDSKSYTVYGDEIKGGSAETANPDSQTQTTLKKAGATKKKQLEHN